ncbi:MAG: hypothetical protein V7K35_27215 [Nostoc sp.]
MTNYPPGDAFAFGHPTAGASLSLWRRPHWLKNDKGQMTNDN